MAFFATPRAVMLVLLVAWHSALILLPMTVFVLGCLYLGMRDIAVLALFGLAGGALVPYLLFWMWWVSPTAGALASIASIAACAAAIAWLAPRSAGTTGHLAPLGTAALVWVAYATFALAFGLAPSGFQSPLDAVQHRFTAELPDDNLLPWAFAQQMAAGGVQVPMAGGWLSSDRPPLQAAYFLASLAPLLPRTEVHYQVQSSLLQALWVPGTWILLSTFGLVRGAVFVALVAGMFSGFAFTHILYTWPKLLPVALVSVAAAVLLNGTRETLSDARVGAAAGASAALAMLSHAGTAFVLIGLGMALVVLRRVPSTRFLVAAGATFFALSLPWMLYQAFVDPPGNRLAKWHLAGAIQVDPRSLVQTMQDAYAALTPGEYLHNKVENLKTVVGPPATSMLVLKASTTGLDDAEGAQLRGLQFFHIVATLGMLALAPLACVAPRGWRTPEFKAALSLFAVCVFTIIPWVILVFLPGQTLIHTGSLAVVCFLFAAAMLAFYALSRWLAFAALGLHLALTLDLYARAKPLAEGASVADYRAFSALALVALAATCMLLWKISAMSERRAIRQ